MHIQVLLDTNAIDITDRMYAKIECMQCILTLLNQTLRGQGQIKRKNEQVQQEMFVFIFHLRDIFS